MVLTEEGLVGGGVEAHRLVQLGRGRVPHADGGGGRVGCQVGG